MKTYLLLILLIYFTSLDSFAQETYTITIDGKSFPIELNRNFTYISESGDSIEFQLEKNGSSLTKQAVARPAEQFINTGTNQVYEDLMIRFEYPENFAIAKTQPANGMQQLTMVSGQGGGIFIQEYSTINPKSLVDFFLTQLVGEQAARNPQNISISLNGQKVKGRFARDSDGNKVAVYSYGKAKQGILLALIGEDSDDEVLRKFLQSVQLKF